MAWCDYDKNREVPKEVTHAMLDLLDRIQYAYLKTDGTYGDLACVVSDKVKYIEKLLFKSLEEDKMSELKAINAYQLTTNTEGSDVYIHNDEFGCGGDLVECYLKSEADKEITRHKYKRCLAMAKWCKSMMVFNDRYGAMTKWLHYNRWRKRWLEIAEKFKPNKEGRR